MMNADKEGRLEPQLGSGFVDLHCHYLPAVDDGVRSVQEGLDLLTALGAAGFSHVVATPHMRPSMFDNECLALRTAFETMHKHVDVYRATNPVMALPSISLACEHYFDDVVYSRLIRGEGLPYKAGRSLLVEFATESFPTAIAARFFDLRCKRLRPVVAHPERYAPFWKNPKKEAETMRRAGGVLLLDLGSIEGKYGAKAQKAANVLLNDDAYYAACSDSHRPADVEIAVAAITRLGREWGNDRVHRLLHQGTREILEGKILDTYD